MNPFLRKVRTASEVTAVQIVEKRHGRCMFLEHLGSAHTEADLAALMQIEREKLAANQPMLDFDEQPVGRPRGSGAVVEGQSSRLVVEVIRFTWERLGFYRIQDEAFFQLVVARLVEPTSKLDSLRVIEELGIQPVHLPTGETSPATLRQEGLPRTARCGEYRARLERTRSERLAGVA